MKWRLLRATSCRGVVYTSCMTQTTTHPLKAAREAHGWTQEELGERASVTRQTVYNIESGRGQPRPASARLLALVLGVPAAELFPDERPSKAVKN